MENMCVVDGTCRRLSCWSTTVAFLFSEGVSTLAVFQRRVLGVSADQEIILEVLRDGKSARRVLKGPRPVRFHRQPSCGPHLPRCLSIDAPGRSSA